MARREKREPPAEGCPLWVVTFGDAISLLVTFFVMLVSFCSFEEEELMSLVGAMKGGLRSAPVEMATSTDWDPPASKATSEKASREPLHKETDLFVKGNSTDAMPSRFYPAHTADYFLQLLDGGISLVIRGESVFETGTAQIRQKDSEVWSLVAGLMGLVSSEVRVVARLPARVPIRLKEYKTPWGLGIEQALTVERFMIERFDVMPGQFSAAVQVLGQMPADESPGGSIEIRFIGRNPLRVKDILRHILRDGWNETPPDLGGGEG